MLCIWWIILFNLSTILPSLNKTDDNYVKVSEKRVKNEWVWLEEYAEYIDGEKKQ